MKTHWYQVLLAGIAIAVLLIFLYLVRGVLPPFVIAFAVAWLLDPLLDRLQRLGCPRIVAVTGVFALFLAVFVVAVIFLVPAIINQADELAKDFPVYGESFKSWAAQVMEKHHDLLVRFQLPSTLQEALAKYGRQISGALQDAIPRLTSWLGANLSKVLWIILIPLLSFYFLSDIDNIRRKAVLFIPAKHRARTTDVLSRMDRVFSGYVRGLTVVCLLYGGLTTLVLLALKLKYGIIIGILAGVLYAVPYLGAITTAVLVFLVGLATYPNGLSQALITTATMLVTNQIFDTIITPRILGKSVGLHPILSMFALLTGGQLFGLAGMILAVPIAASVQEIVFEFYPELKQSPAPKKPQSKFTRKKKES